MSLHYVFDNIHNKYLILVIYTKLRCSGGTILVNHAIKNNILSDRNTKIFNFITFEIFIHFLWGK